MLKVLTRAVQCGNQLIFDQRERVCVGRGGKVGGTLFHAAQNGVMQGGFGGRGTGFLGVRAVGGDPYIVRKEGIQTVERTERVIGVPHGCGERVHDGTVQTEGKGVCKKCRVQTVTRGQSEGNIRYAERRVQTHGADEPHRL